jgi:hypothetical protein
MNKTYLIAAVVTALLFGYAVGFSHERHQYNDLVERWNAWVDRTTAHKMAGTGNWYCGRMVVSCNED